MNIIRIPLAITETENYTITLNEDCTITVTARQNAEQITLTSKPYKNPEKALSGYLKTIKTLLQ